MQILENGIYTGKKETGLNKDGIFINTISYSKDEESIGNHFHVNPHICFLLQGNDKVRRGKNIYTRSTGDLYFYRSCEEHETIRGNSLIKTLILELDNPFLIKYDLTEEQMAMAITKSNTFKLNLLKTFKECQDYDQSNTIIDFQMLVLNLFSIEDKLLNYPVWLKRIEQVLQDKWNETVTLDELAAEVNIHPVTISKYFVKYQKETLSQYIRNIKIERSLSLIKNSTQTLTEIALNCGFADQSHFIRCFKQTTGFLPKDFRKF